MSSQLDAITASAGPEIYYTDAFRDTIEDHLMYLKNHPTTTMMMIENSDVLRYRFDLGGLLHTYSVPVHMHWIIARMNGYTSLHGDSIKKNTVTDSYQLLVPDASIVDGIAQMHNTRNTIT